MTRHPDPPKLKARFVPAEGDNRTRGKRGQGSKQRRSIERTARQRQDTWLNTYTDTNPVPLRIRIAKLTAQLDSAYQSKRQDDHKQ